MQGRRFVEPGGLFVKRRGSYIMTAVREIGGLFVKQEGFYITSSVFETNGFLM